MKNHFLSLFVLLLAAQVSWAADINSSTSLKTYYAGADDKSDEALRSALSAKINPHTKVIYDNLGLLFQWSDTYNAAGEKIDDIYSHCDPAYTKNWCSGGKCGYNREHSLPKSWWGDGKDEKYSDAFHLYPTNCYVNSYRGNLPFGECSGGTKCTTNGVNGKGRRGNCTFVSESGTNYSSVGECFEPDDAYKGDLARSYFYMATCYIDADYTKDANGREMFTHSSDKAQFTKYAIDLLLKWHRQDPVSERELLRNEVIYGNPLYNKCDYHQGNRNPFIDYPELAEYIWGNKKGEKVKIVALDSPYANEEPQDPTAAPIVPVSEPAARKVLREGRLLIIVGEEIYTVTGQRVL